MIGILAATFLAAIAATSGETASAIVWVVLALIWTAELVRDRYDDDDWGRP